MKMDCDVKTDKEKKNAHPGRISRCFRRIKYARFVMFDTFQGSFFWQSVVTCGLMRLFQSTKMLHSGPFSATVTVENLFYSKYAIVFAYDGFFLYVKHPLSIWGTETKTADYFNHSTTPM